MIPFTSRARGIALLALVAAAALLAAGPANAAAPKLPKAVKKIDRQLTKASKRLGKKQTARLRRPLRSAGGALRRRRSCQAARSLTTVVVRAGKLDGRQAAAAAPVARGAQRLSEKLVRSQRRKGACGLKIRVRTKRSLRPALSALPGLPGAPERPVFRLAGSHASSDFAAREIIFATSGRRGLAALLRRTRGKLIRTTSSPRAKTKQSTLHLIRLPGGTGARASASTRSELVDDLRAIDPLSRGSVAVSNSAGLGTLATAADERARGLHVGLNPVILPTATAAEAFPGQSILDGFAAEGFALEGTKNSLDWSYLGDRGKNAYGIHGAWRMLEAARLFGQSIRVAIVDGGFASLSDLPLGSNATAMGTTDDGHGFKVAQTLAAVPGNEMGTAGPGGPVSRLRMIDYDFDGISLAARIYDAIGSDARIINMSVGSEMDAVVGWATLPVEDAAQEAVENNVLPIASAGNDNRDVDAQDCVIVCWEEEVITPCEEDGVFCVGGLEVDRDKRAVTGEDSGSNFGKESCDYARCDVDLFGPYFYPVLKPDGTFQSVPGTSFSAPFVSGVAALLLAAKPSLRQNELRDILIDTAHRSSDDTVSAVVNAKAAVARALGPRPPRVGIATPRAGDGAYSGTAEALDGLAVSASEASCCTYRWLNNGTFIGNGPLIQSRLNPGPQRVTLEATDGAGRTGSASVTVDRVPKFSEKSTLTAACPGVLAPGSTAEVPGLLTPGKDGSAVRIEVTDPAGGKQTYYRWTSGDGAYSLSFPVGMAGTWRVAAHFAGDAGRDSSSASCSFVVATVNPGDPTPTNIDLHCPNPNRWFSTDGAFNISGDFDPDGAATLLFIELRAPDGTLQYPYVLPNAQGNFQYTFHPQHSAVGNWQVTAEFTGLPGFAQSRSNTCTISIVPPPK